MIETMGIGPEVETTANLEEFQKDIEEIKRITHEPPFIKVNPKELGWEELDLYYYLKKIEDSTSTEEEIIRFKNKFEEVKSNSDGKNHSQLMFLKYLENRLNK